jgi:hypothetical protein
MTCPLDLEGAVYGPNPDREGHSPDHFFTRFIGGLSLPVIGNAITMYPHHETLV